VSGGDVPGGQGLPGRLPELARHGPEGLGQRLVFGGVGRAGAVRRVRRQPAGSPARREAVASHPGSSPAIPGSPTISRHPRSAATRRRRPGHHGQGARHARPADPDRGHPADHRTCHARLAPPRRALARHRGQYCYVAALLPGRREPTPILRLRYQGSAGRWAIGIYLASSDRYTESELPASFGPKTGTPEEGVDDTFVLYAGPKSGH